MDLGRAGRRPCRPTGCIHGHPSRGDHIGGGPKQRTGGLCVLLLCQRRRFALLRARPGWPTFYAGSQGRASRARCPSIERGQIM